MATYLYCILSEPRDVPPTRAGIDGAAVRCVGATGLAAWVGSVAEVPVTPTVDRLIAHDAVCGAALDVGETPLPVRFGQTFADDGAVVTALTARRHALGQQLARVAGCAELRVVAWRQYAASGAASVEFREAQAQEAPGRVVGPGTAFLFERARQRREERQREHWCEKIRGLVAAAAGGLIVEYQRCEVRRGLAYLPLLVRRTDLERCRPVIAASLPTSTHAVSVLGPFPPYSFAGDV